MPRMSDLNLTSKLPARPGVYMIRNLISGKVYIGSATTSIRMRAIYHRSFLRRRKHDNRHLQRSWDKHGASVFDFTVLIECEATQCLILEQHYIESLKATDPGRGYNQCPVVGSAMAGRNHTVKSRAKMSAARQGTRPCALAVAKAAAANRGKQRSVEIRAKISQGNKGKRKAWGEKVNTAKLTEAEVRSIREVFAQGESGVTLARRYHVSRSTIHRIVTRRMWTHVI